MPWGWDSGIEIGKGYLVVRYPYTGAKECSVNHIYEGHRLRDSAKLWRDTLAMLIHAAIVEHYEPRPPITIRLYGKFRDNRGKRKIYVPDLANLHKQIGDAVEAALGIDDREFRFVDEGYEQGEPEPHLIIRIEWGEDG